MNLTFSSCVPGKIESFLKNPNDQQSWKIPTQTLNSFVVVFILRTRKFWRLSEPYSVVEMFMESTGIPLAVIPFSCDISKSCMTMKHSHGNENIWEFFVRCIVTYTVWWYSLWFQKKKTHKSLWTLIFVVLSCCFLHTKSYCSLERKKKDINSLSWLLSGSHPALTAKSYTKITLITCKNPTCKEWALFLTHGSISLRKLFPYYRKQFPYYRKSLLCNSHALCFCLSHSPYITLAFFSSDLAPFLVYP